MRRSRKCTIGRELEGYETSLRARVRGGETGCLWKQAEYQRLNHLLDDMLQHQQLTQLTMMLMHCTYNLADSIPGSTQQDEDHWAHPNPNGDCWAHLSALWLDFGTNEMIQGQRPNWFCSCPCFPLPHPDFRQPQLSAAVSPDASHSYRPANSQVCTYPTPNP